MRAERRVWGGVLVALLSGCGGIQSVLAPMTPEPRSIDSLWWTFFWTTAITFVVVIGMTAFATVAAAKRARVERDAAPLTHDDARTHRRLASIVGAAVGVTAIVLFTLLVESERASHALERVDGRDALEIDVIGHQWWWEIHYRHPRASERIVTANELYVPTGRRIVLHLTSRDVIHSLWLPDLHGKLDLIPGFDRTLAFELGRPGVYRDQCAEFCGHQHAHMGLRLAAVDPARFEAWRRAQLEPAREPRKPLERRGREVFLSTSCPMCHTIRGTSAAATVGPDLTHLASRSTLAAGAAPNNVGHLAGFILDPQSMKPGVHMPPNGLSGPELEALLAYLRSLR